MTVHSLVFRLAFSNFSVQGHLLIFVVFSDYNEVQQPYASLHIFTLKLLTNGL